MFQEGTTKTWNLHGSQKGLHHSALHTVCKVLVQHEPNNQTFCTKASMQNTWNIQLNFCPGNVKILPASWGTQNPEHWWRNEGAPLVCSWLHPLSQAQHKGQKCLQVFLSHNPCKWSSRNSNKICSPFPTFCNIHCFCLLFLWCNLGVHIFHTHPQ